MTIQKAFQLAGKGGYKKGWTLVSANKNWVDWDNGRGSSMQTPTSNHLLNPDFWRGFSKNLSFGSDCGFTKCPAEGEHKKCWMKLWHSLIDHLAEGGSIESFFAGLEEGKE